MNVNFELNAKHEIKNNMSMTWFSLDGRDLSGKFSKKKKKRKKPDCGEMIDENTRQKNTHL